MLSCASHITVLSVITRAMNVRNQPSQAFVTCLSPFFDCSCKFVYRPQKVWSTNSCQVPAFLDYLWAYVGQCSHWFKFFLFELMIIQALTWNFVKLLHFFCVPTRSIAQRIFEHVLPCRWTTPPFLREAFSHPGNFSVAPPEMCDSNIFVCCSIIISIGLHSRWVHPKRMWSRNDVGSSRSMLFINFFHNRVIFCFFPANFYVVHVDFESSRSPATSESRNSPNLQCCGVLPIWEYRL